MAARKTSSQIVLDIFLRESPEVCDQLLGVAKAALKAALESRRTTAARPVARAARKPAQQVEPQATGDLS